MVRSEMTGNALSALLMGLLLPLAPRLPAQELLSPGITDTLRQIIDHSISQRYEASFKLCRSLQKAHPENPAGYFFEAATWQTFMLDFEDDSEEDRFFALTKKVRELCKRRLHAGSRDSWTHFFLGGALGYEAYFLGRKRKLLNAFREGWASIQELEAARAIDSTNYDALLGIGTYKYYQSQYSKYVNWLPFLRDTREQGILMIKTAMRRGLFSKPAAMNALLWIYIGEKKLALARALAEKALRAYPQSRFFLWGAATVAFKQQNWPAAKKYYTQILDSYRRGRRRSNYNELVCHARLAEIYARTGDSIAAQDQARLALAIDIRGMENRKARNHRKRAQKVLDALAIAGQLPEQE